MSRAFSGSALRPRLVEDVRTRLFRPASGPPARRGYGAEVEFLALDGDSAAPVHPDRSLPFLRAYGHALGWRIEPGRHGVPSIRLPGGGRVTFEPGGQIEIATPPRASVAGVAADLERVIPSLVAAAADEGIRFLGLGIDPVNPLDRAELVLPGERYRSMHRYLGRIGDAGPRMMLQTAAIQVNVELCGPDGEDRGLRWRVLNAAAPFITAIFANSHSYGGADSGYASYRARQWRLLDRRRTGLLGREQDIETEYADFALEAGWMFGDETEGPGSFSEGVIRGEHTLDDWRKHLTTLFPEIRPRGYLEVRCIDALPPEWCVVPVALLAGMLADGRSVREAAEIVGAPDSMLLQDAARMGLRDPRLAGSASALFDMAVRAGERTGVLVGPALERARDFHDQYTSRGRSPGGGRVHEAA